MSIPIENIYFLLCYAWDKLDEKERVNVAVDDKTELLDLFAKILINGTRILIKRGIDKNYLDHSMEIPGVKGKVQISQTLKSNLLFKQRTICTFDDFSSNILSNRILVTTISTLAKTNGLDPKLRMELRGLERMLSNIQPIEFVVPLFKQIRLNRNNSYYGFIIDVCQIIHESILPSEEQGKYEFTDFTRDERKMNQLFEAFVRNFYLREQKKYQTVRREIIRWKFEGIDPNKDQYLPQMRTDITLENESEKVIIDAKYYSETLALHYDTQRIRSSNLYQLFSYLINQEDGSLKTQGATGILLYPTIEKEYDLVYRFGKHHFQVRTVNLNASWKNISSRLKEIIQV